MHIPIPISYIDYQVSYTVYTKYYTKNLSHNRGLNNYCVLLDRMSFRAPTDSFLSNFCHFDCVLSELPFGGPYIRL